MRSTEKDLHGVRRAYNKGKLNFLGIKNSGSKYLLGKEGKYQTNIKSGTNNIRKEREYRM